MLALTVTKHFLCLLTQTDLHANMHASVGLHYMRLSKFELWQTPQIASGFTDLVCLCCRSLHNTHFDKAPAPHNYTTTVKSFDQLLVWCTLRSEEKPKTDKNTSQGRLWFVIGNALVRARRGQTSHNSFVRNGQL